MANIIKLKQSNQAGKVPLVGDLVLGEPALNTTDGRLYIKKSVGGVESIVDIGNNQAIADLQASSSSASGAIATLQSDLAAEITNRIADVDAEEARAGAAESALDVRVTAIESYDKETVYVDSVNGVDAVGRGSFVKPFKTINYAYSQVPSVVGATDLEKVTQFVSEKLVFELAPGAYTENVTVGFKRARVAIVGNGARIIGNVKCQVLKSSFPVASLESYKAQLPAPWTGFSAQMCFEIAGEAGGGLEGDATASIVTVTGLTSLEFENGGANYNWDTQYGQFYSYFDNVNLVGGFNLVHDNTVTTARAPACVVEIESSKVGSGDSATRSYLGFVPFGAATTVPAYGGLTLKTHNSTIASVLGPTITIGEVDGCRIYDIDRTMGGVVTNGSVSGSSSTSYVGIVNTQFRAFSGAAGASVYKIGASAANVAYKIDSVSHGTLTFGRTLDIASGRTVTYTLLDRAAGVVVVPAGNLASTTVQAALEELQGDVNTINTSLASKADTSALTAETNARIAADSALDTRVTSVEGSITSLTAEDLTLLKKDGSRALTGDLSAGSNKVTNLAAPTANGDAANKQYVDDSVSAVSGDLSVLQSDLAQAQTDIDNLQSDVSGLDSRITSAESNIGTLQTGLSSAETDISSLQTDVSTAQSNITSLQGDVSTAQSNITSLQGDVSTLQGSVSTLQGDVSTLQGNYATVSGDITSLQTDLSAAEADIVALDLRVDALEATPRVQVYDDYSSLPGSGAEEVVYITADNNEIYRWEVVTLPESYDFTVGATGDFATLEAALASASVQNGHKIFVQAGTYSVASTINVSKQVKVYGAGVGQAIFETAGGAGDPVSMFNVSVDNVLFKGLTIKHRKTSNTSVETAVVVSGGGFPQTRVANFIMDDCRVEHVEFAVTVRGSDWKLANSQFAYEGPNNSTRRHVGVYGVSGNCFIVNNTSSNNAATGSLRWVQITSTTGTNPNETLVGKLVVQNNSQISGALAQFISQDAWQGSAGGFQLLVKSNSTNETSAFVSFYGTAANFGDILGDVTVSGNALSNTHGGTNNGGKGVIGVDGTAAFRSSNLVVHAVANTLANSTYRTDYVAVDGTTVGRNTVIPSFSASTDSSIPANPTEPTTPSAGGGTSEGYVALTVNTLDAGTF